MDAQTERHIKSRHKARIRTMDQIREDPKTCPEETVYQLGTKDGHEDPALFAQVVAELVEEFTKRFGSHVQVLDWALHMDEATIKSDAGTNDFVMTPKRWIDNSCIMP